MSDRMNKDDHKRSRSRRAANRGQDDPVRLATPGKRTLSECLPPQVSQRSAATPAVIQHRSASSSGPRCVDQTGPIADWTAAVYRPDVYQQPVLRKSIGEVGKLDEPPRPSSGGGQPLPAAVQAKMEAAFAADFSAVRIHEGPQATAMGALAYTQANEIHFAPGQYQPHSLRGQELLGHELTHVVQQAQGRVSATPQANGLAINDDPALEREADVMGARAARAARGAPHTHDVRHSAHRDTKRRGLHNAPAGEGPTQCMPEDRYRELCTQYGRGAVKESLARLNQNWETADANQVEHDIKAKSQQYNSVANEAQDGPLQHGEPGEPPFENWLRSGKEPSKMNCWEYLLYVAAKAGDLKRPAIASIYTNPLDGQLISVNVEEILTANKERVIDWQDTANFSYGDAIILGEVGRHVLLSLGGPQVADLGTWTLPRVTTLAEVMASNANNMTINRQHLTSILSNNCCILLEPKRKDFESKNESDKSEQVTRFMNQVADLGSDLKSGSFGAMCTTADALRDATISRINQYALTKSAIDAAVMAAITNEISRATNVRDHVYRVARGVWVNAIKVAAAG